VLFVIKHFTKYTFCCRTHLTTLSHLLAVGGVTNSIRDKVQRNFMVMDIIKQRKLQLFGHICHMPDKILIKTIMLDMVDEDRHRDRPPRS